MAEEAQHSKYSASGFAAARLCAGKWVMEQGKPDTSSAYAREGTAAHKVLELCLTEGQPASAYEGRIIQVPDAQGKLDPILVDEEMVNHIAWSVRALKALAGDNAIMAETRVNYAADLGVEEREGWGTADAIIAADDTLIVADLKYGQNPVSPERNDQMMLYGLGALRVAQGILGDFTKVTLVILQPRKGHEPSIWETTVAELYEWASTTAVEAVMRRIRAEEFDDGPFEEFVDTFLTVGDMQCKYCRAKATCPKLLATVAETVSAPGETPASAADFDSLTPAKGEQLLATEADQLAASLRKVDLIEGWCKAVRTEAERRMFAGDEVPGFKLVAGKKGNRAWGDEAAVEGVLKGFRLKQEQIFDFKLKSPAQIAKLGPKFNKEGKAIPLAEGDPKPLIGERQWPKVAALITQADGKAHVAPTTDPRPALSRQPIADQFSPPAEESFSNFA